LPANGSEGCRFAAKAAPTGASTCSGLGIGIRDSGFGAVEAGLCACEGKLMHL